MWMWRVESRESRVETMRGPGPLLCKHTSHVLLQPTTKWKSSLLHVKSIKRLCETIFLGFADDGTESHDIGADRRRHVRGKKTHPFRCFAENFWTFDSELVEILQSHFQNLWTFWRRLLFFLKLWRFSSFRPFLKVLNVVDEVWTSWKIYKLFQTFL